MRCFFLVSYFVLLAQAGAASALALNGGKRFGRGGPESYARSGPCSRGRTVPFCCTGRAPEKPSYYVVRTPPRRAFRRWSTNRMANRTSEAVGRISLRANSPSWEGYSGEPSPRSGANDSFLSDRIVRSRSTLVTGAPCAEALPIRNRVVYGGMGRRGYFRAAGRRCGTNRFESRLTTEAAGDNYHAPSGGGGSRCTVNITTGKILDFVDIDRQTRRFSRPGKNGRSGSRGHRAAPAASGSSAKLRNRTGPDSGLVGWRSALGRKWRFPLRAASP